MCSIFAHLGLSLAFHLGSLSKAQHFYAFRNICALELYLVSRISYLQTQILEVEIQTFSLVFLCSLCFPLKVLNRFRRFSGCSLVFVESFEGFNTLFNRPASSFWYVNKLLLSSCVLYVFLM